MNTDPFSLVRVFNRMRQAGFSLSVDGEDLVVKPAQTLTDTQRAYLREHKVALVQLLTDAEALAKALEQAGADGLAWCEGTPLEWIPTYLTAVGEILYSQQRMVSVLGRRYLPAVAPSVPILKPAAIVAEATPTEVAA